MGSEPVRVWLACACGKLMASFTKEDTADFVKIGPIGETVVQIPEEEVHEFVLVPASDYRQQTADLSHADIVRIIAEIAHQDWLVALKEDSLAPKDASVRVAAQFVELAIAAARKIESEAK